MFIPYERRFYDTNKWHGQIAWANPIETVPSVIAKCYDGTGRMFEDDLFWQFWARLKSIGYQRGSYLFYWPKGKDQAVRQAERYVRTLAGDYGTLTYLNPKGERQPVLCVDFEPRNTAKKFGWVVPVATPAMRDDLHVCLETITPRRVDTALVTVAALDFHMQLGPGEERTFDIPYVEQTSGARISASNIQTPVATTDYKFGSTDGTSSDLNANLLITMPAVPGANSCHVAVKNTGTSSGYINLFQLRGYGIYPYNSYTVEVGSGGLRVAKLDMPYQDNPNVADAVANYLQSASSDNTRRGARIRVTANKSAAAMAFALTGNISTRWTVAETLTGLSGDHFVNGRKRTMSLGNLLTVEALMVPAGSSSAWVLGTSALDTDTKLAV